MKPLSLLISFVIVFCLALGWYIPVHADPGVQVTPQCIEGNCVNGYGTQKYPKGTYEGGFINSKFHGHGRLTFLNGSIFFGGFSDGYRKGAGVFMTSNGDIYKGTWDRSNKASCVHKVGENDWEQGMCDINKDVISFEKGAVPEPTFVPAEKGSQNTLPATVSESVPAKKKSDSDWLYYGMLLIFVVVCGSSGWAASGKKKGASSSSDGTRYSESFYSQENSFQRNEQGDLGTRDSKGGFTRHGD